MKSLPQIFLYLFCGLIFGLSIANPPPVYDSMLYDGQSIDTLIFKGFGIFEIAYLILHYFFISWLGWVLIYPLVRDLKTSIFIKFISGFCVGFLMSIGIIRLCSFFFSYEGIYWPVTICLLGLTIFMTAVHIKTGMLKLSLKCNIMRLIGLMAFAASFIASVLMLQVRQAEFIWVGHGPNQYSRLIYEWGQKGLEHFPILLQHYDELIFHYYLTMPLGITFDQIVPWWVTLAITKLSMFFLIYLAFRKLNVTPFLSAMFVTFMFWGTSSVLANKYYLLFDSQNFLYFTVHAGRIVGAGIVFLILVDFLQSKNQGQMTKLFYLLVGVGAGALTLPNSLWIIFYALIIWIIKNYCASDERVGKLTWFHDGSILIVFSLLSMLLMYGLSFVNALALDVRSFLVMILCVYMTFRILCRVIRSNAFELLKGNQGVKCVLLISGVLISLLLFGNIFANNVISQSIISSNIPVEELNNRLAAGRNLNVWDYRQKIGHWNAYSWGLKEFVACYGWILLMVGFVFYLFKYRAKQLLEVANIDRVFYEVFVLTVGILPCLLFLVEFLPLGKNSWLKSRFIEMPVYILIFISFYLISRWGSYRQKTLVAVLCIIYTVTPFVATQRHLSISNNSHYFMKMLSDQSDH